jgi:predicted nucleic acid-binding protein
MLLFVLAYPGRVPFSLGEKVAGEAGRMRGPNRNRWRRPAPLIAQIVWASCKDFDRLIGTHALAAGCTLVAANAPDFSDIPGLPLENWTLPD